MVLPAASGATLTCQISQLLVLPISLISVLSCSVPQQSHTGVTLSPAPVKGVAPWLPYRPTDQWQYIPQRDIHEARIMRDGARPMHVRGPSTRLHHKPAAGFNKSIDVVSYPTSPSVLPYSSSCQTPGLEAHRRASAIVHVCSGFAVPLADPLPW